MSWHLELDLSAPSPQPTFLRIARAVTADVQRGRLLPGARLPGSRRLAAALGVHRNTVLAAYDELASEGWLETREGSGTFVASDLPERRAAAPKSEAPTAPGFDLGPAPAPPPPDPFADPPPGALLLNSGMPDLRLAPTAELARAYRRALRRAGSSLLSYGDVRGLPRLRAALADMLRVRRGLPTADDQILVTRGSQMALHLVARALLGPGDRVAVEALGYPPAWQALRETGAELVPIPVDDQGLRVDALEAALADAPIRALYVTPHHQFPTMAVLPAPRRLRLLALAQAHRFAIIEDDYDNEFHYEGRPVLPLAASDRAGVVVYVGTLSKVVAPGLRIGWAAAPAPVIERMAILRRAVDRQGDQAVERAVAELLEDDTIPRHVRRMRRVYAARREAVLGELRERLAGALTVEAPAGGIALWPRVADDLDADDWAAACRAEGVVIAPGRLYDIAGRYQPHFRLGFASLDDAELRAAIEGMAQAIRR